MTTTATKGFVSGTHRAMPPEETLARIRPHLPRAAAVLELLDAAGVEAHIVWCPTDGERALRFDPSASVP